MTTTDTPKVWIGCLASYNAGRLIGQWVDATDADEMYEAQERVGAEAVEAAKEAKEYPVYFGDPEEFFIADYDGFGDLPSTLGEYANYETVAKIGRLIEEHDGAFIAYVSACEPDLETLDENDFYAHYRGEFDSEEAFARQTVQEIGWSNVPAQLDVPTGPYGQTQSMNIFEELESYIDWESIARELRGGYSFADAGGGSVYVFEDEV